jgi:hypothetical protein
MNEKCARMQDMYCDKYDELIKASFTVTRLAACYRYYKIYLITSLYMYAHNSRWGVTTFPSSDVHCLLFHLIFVRYADASTVVAKAVSEETAAIRDTQKKKLVRWKINKYALPDCWLKHCLVEGGRISPYDG